MSRLRIIRDGTYTWLDEGPGNGANGPARVSGALLVAPSPKPKVVPRLTCLHCGVSIVGRVSRALFCSTLCQQRAKAIRQRQRAKVA